jgi:hypothetical protein
MTQADEASTPIQPEPEQQPQPAPGPAVDPQPAPAPEPEPTAAPEPAPAPEPEPDSTAAPEPPQRETLVDAIADLLQMAVNYLRAEAADIVRDKVVLPTQQLGMMLAFVIAAATLMVVGVLFIAVALLILLAHWIGWIAALALVGAVLLVGAGVFTYLKVRSIQK